MASDQSWIADLMKFVNRGGPEGIAALEHSLIQEALVELDRLRPELEKVAAEAVLSKRADSRRFYRAVAKAALKTGMRPPERVMQVIRKEERPTVRQQVRVEGYTTQSGIKRDSYWRTLPEGTEPAAGDEVRDNPDDVEALREWEREQAKAKEERSIFGDSPYSSGFSDGLDLDAINFDNFEITAPATPRQALDSETAQSAKEATKAYLQQNNAASGVRAVADFFANKPGKLQFAWNAISKFGPIAGTRVAFNYYRTGGYALPLEQDGTQIVTEFNDVLPPPESRAKTRTWAVQALMSRLPGQAVYANESEPPSEGFIIDGDGHVVAHAVGRGNDNWLPFNMTQLRAMRKQNNQVEYVRSRLVGGPTGEDISTAMALGVDRLTVVSQSGVFSMKIKPRAHGLKIEHMQIVDRYNDLLDEIQSGKSPAANKLDYVGYAVALDTLAAEFPLHLISERPRRNDASGWSTNKDYTRPTKRLTDQIRDLFDIEINEIEEIKGRKASRVETITPNSNRDKDLRRKHLGMTNNYQDVRAYITDQVRRNPGSTASYLNRLEKYYRDTGRGDPRKQQWVKELFSIDQNKNPSDMTQPARPVAPPDPTLQQGGRKTSDSGAFTPGEVTTRQVEPTAQKAKSGKVKNDNFPTAVQRASQMGLNPNEALDKGSANRVFQQLERMDDEEFDEFWGGSIEDSLTDPQHRRLYKEMLDTFRLA